MNEMMQNDEPELVDTPEEEMAEGPEDVQPEMPVEGVTDHLYEAVGNALVVWMNYKAYHWLLFGPRFHDLHGMFGEFADSVYGTVDELAERLRMLDDYPPTSLQEAASAAKCRPTQATNPQDMVTEALGNTEYVIQCMREGAEAAQNQNDPGTVDMFSKFVQIYEKQRWFLKQIAQPERQTPPLQ